MRLMFGEIILHQKKFTPKDYNLLKTVWISNPSKTKSGMKKIIYLSVLLAFIACKENKQEKAATMPLVETPNNGLFFEGSKENAQTYCPSFWG